jgi:hypothetical protein
MIILAFLLYLFSVIVMGGVALAILDMGDEI